MPDVCVQVYETFFYHFADGNMERMFPGGHVINPKQIT